MPIRDVALKTDRKQWTIERSGEGSGISVLIARHHDDYEIIFDHKFLIKQYQLHKKSIIGKFLFC